MLANFFEKSKPITFVFLMVLFSIYFGLAYFRGLTISFFVDNGVISYITYFTFVFLGFFFYNFIVVKNNLTFDNAYAFIFFILCLGLIPQTFLNEKTLFLNLTFLLFLRKVYSLQSSKKVFFKLFDGGFFLGICFLFEPFLVIFTILFYYAIYIHQKIIYQTLLIPIIGFIVPLFIYFSYCFWSDTTESFYQLFYWITTYDLSLYMSFKFLFPIALVSLFLGFSILAKTPRALSVKNTFRKSWILILIHFLTTLVLILLLKEHDGSELLFLFFPLSVILANGLELIEKYWLKDLILSAFLTGSIVVYFL